MPVYERVGPIVSRALPCAGFWQGKYDIHDLFVGVPCLLGDAGVEKIIEVDLDANEQKLMAQSAAHVQELVDAVKDLYPQLA